jgi:hypothetical protein
VAVLLVAEHQLHQPLQLWAVQVVAEALMALLLVLELQAVLVIQEHLRLLLEQT